MAGKPRPDGHRIHVNVKLSDAEAAVIDGARGDADRGPWMREAALSVARGIPESRSPAPAPAKRSRPKAAVPAPVPPPAGPPASGGTATAVFQPPGGDAVVTAPVAPRVTAPSLRRASDLPVPPRCPHKGIRITGGWCVTCQADVKAGGRLPDGWVKPEGWTES